MKGFAEGRVVVLSQQDSALLKGNGRREDLMERKTKQPGGVKETPAGATRAKARAKKASGAATTEAKKAQGGRRGKKQNGEADLEIVKDLLESFKEKMKNNFKPGVGDLIRLMQLRRELEKDDVREILVQWVDQTKELDSSSEE